MDKKDLTNMSSLELEVFEQNLNAEFEARVRNMINDPKILEIQQEILELEKEKYRRKHLNNG